MDDITCLLVLQEETKVEECEGESYLGVEGQLLLQVLMLLNIPLGD